MTNSKFSGHLWVPIHIFRLTLLLFCVMEYCQGYISLWSRCRFGIMSSQLDDPAGTSTSKEVRSAEILRRLGLRPLATVVCSFSPPLQVAAHRGTGDHVKTEERWVDVWNDQLALITRPAHWLRGCSVIVLREGRCVRYRCGLINTIADVLRQRPGWVEVKEWVGLRQTDNYKVFRLSVSQLFFSLSLYLTAMESGTSTGVMGPGLGSILITPTWRSMSG